MAGETENYRALQLHKCHYSICLFKITLVIKGVWKNSQRQEVSLGDGAAVVVMVTTEEELRKTTAIVKPTEKPSESTCHSPNKCLVAQFNIKSRSLQEPLGARWPKLLPGTRPNDRALRLLCLGDGLSPIHALLILQQFFLLLSANLYPTFPSVTCIVPVRLGAVFADGFCPHSAL